MMSDRPLRVGIISANWGAFAHLPAWRSIDGVEVTAICTSRPETAQAAAREHGIDRAFHDFRVMAEDDEIDLIDCGTRPPLRYKMVMAALDAGKHVYNGIPFATSLAAAKAMEERRAQAGSVAAVDAFLQAVPQLVHLKELLDQGVIGTVQGLRLNLDMTLFTDRLVNAPTYAWFADPANGASVMRNNGSHMVHLLVHLFGVVEAIVADLSIGMERWTMPDGATIVPKVYDNATGLLRFRSGLVGQFSTCWSMPDASGFVLDVWGTTGRLVAKAPTFPQAFNTRLFFGGIAALGLETTKELPLPDRLQTIPGSSARADAAEYGVFPMATIFSSMLRAVRGEGSASPDFAQAVHVQAVIEAATLSSTERRWVSVGGP
jgi:predicted dehydrogenase